ncbi:MAG: 16S rRNA (guanine(527)-N(7))-methyltransferase RsmG [Anaerolineae bacterium]|nr:16S rRNA (guanine(527)-N(7))-methyltransferase RsmG [Anaerolineae bacterium]MCX8067786.1 16S rRNA (guanine(527)-N(7))-methyltransferase RsmG [Anaerolineae bacterium]MDW7991152.1 16S rRNA (guanine(527)-N(7))-methyltransferase RsmG [Anaerolineae bacterium]
MDKLLRGARELGITLKESHLALFQTYYEELVEWNRRFNLTAITDYEGVQVRHFLDSLSCLLVLPRAELQAGARVIDVGTGAGFPGLPLRIVCPGMRLTLLEATRKKVEFLEHITRKLGLRDVEIIWGRAEDLAHRPGYREAYDWALARALADMPTLVEYLLPFVRVRGAMLAQKGENAPAEVHSAEEAIRILGGEVRKLVPVGLHGLAETRYLVIVDKRASTPDKYPRRPGIPEKRPLGVPPIQLSRG